MCSKSYAYKLLTPSYSDADLSPLSPPQVPQFLLEAGYGCSQFPERRGAVGVTQPRRVAAVSTATRVAQELGEELGKTVGYQV